MSSDWFTTEKIDEKTFAISEYGHWEETHCYLFLGDKKAVLIDTGLGIGNLKESTDSLTSLPVIAIVTHGHWDHTGGLKWFNNFGIHKDDTNWLENRLPISDDVIRKTFSYKPLTKSPPDYFDINKYHPFKGKPKFLLKDGDIIDLGNRQLRVLHTPGHSPGSICIYEKSTGYLATGDTLYKGTLDAFYESTDPNQFAESIDKLNKIPLVTKILPGHHQLNISTDLLREAQQAFFKIKSKGALHHGTGIHAFKHLKIHL